jgi:hypothetical protein
VIRFIFVLFVLLFSSSSFAGVGITDFFGEVSAFFESIWYFITTTIPSVINSFFVWVYSYALYLYFSFLFAGIEFSHSVALTFLDMININEVVNTAAGALPSDMKQAAIDMRFFDALTLIVEAAITRFVYSSV